MNLISQHKDNRRQQYAWLLGQIRSVCTIFDFLLSAKTSLSSQINNLLNRQLSGLYRRSQISLNAPTSGGSATPVASTSSAVLPDPASAKEDSDLDGTPLGSRSTSPGAGQGEASGSSASASATLKRKTRSSDNAVTSHGVNSEADKQIAGPSTPSTSTKRTRSSVLAGKGNVAQTKPNARKPPTTRLADLGGIASCIEQVLELIAMPICHPEIYLHTGVRPPRGVLLYGPPGCGKTMLANAIAGVSSMLLSGTSNVPDEYPHLIL